MSPFWQAFWGGFLGKIAGAVFIAACVVMWLGPEDWVQWIVSGLPTFFTPAVARWVFFSLGFIVVFWMVRPLFNVRHRLRRIRRISSEEEISTKSNVAVIISALRMTIGESGPYFKTEGSVYGIRRTFNLKLENVNRSKSLSDCSIHIMEVVPPTGYEGPWLLKDGITLAAGAHIFVPLVTYGEAREPDKSVSGDTFVTMETSTDRPTLDVGPQYTVTLRATAPETAFRKLQCNVWVDGNGRLRIANTTTTATDKLAAIPLDQASLFAYVNGEPRVRTLDRKIAGKLGKEYRDYVGERASLNEKLPKFRIKTIRELDDLPEEKSDLIRKICAYAIPEGPIEKGHSLDVLTWVLGAQMGADRFIQILESCKYTSTSRGWVEGIVSAYTQLTKHG